MSVTHEVRAFDYANADEIVVRLDRDGAFDLIAGVPMPTTCLPAWTIADITARVERGGRHAYAIRFRHHDAVCIALVGEEFIDRTG
jgi:hypothetical protein